MIRLELGKVKNKAPCISTHVMTLIANIIWQAGPFEFEKAITGDHYISNSGTFGLP